MFSFLSLAAVEQVVPLPETQETGAAAAASVSDAALGSPAALRQLDRRGAGAAAFARPSFRPKTLTRERNLLFSPATCFCQHIRGSRMK